MKNIRLLLFCSICFFLISPSFSFAQKDEKSHKLLGTVVDEITGKALPDITVMTISRTDGKVISGISTDAKGEFTITGIHENIVKTKLSGIGYRTQIIDSVSLDGTTRLGLIKLSPASVEMPEMVIKALKPMVDYQIDKKVVNIDRVPGSSSGSITEALRNSGQVDVDPSTNKITVHGQEVKIQMDGHEFNMTGDALAQMPATMIDEVEVILSPGAKESAEAGEGGGYIVNIITKKNKVDNYNGSLSISSATNNRNYGTVNLGFKTGKLNMFGMFSGGVGKGNSNSSSEQINYLSKAHHFENSAGKDDYDANGIYSKLGFDYFFDDNNTFTFFCNYNTMNWDGNSYSKKIIANDSSKFQYDYINSSENDYTSKNLSLNAFYKKKFATKGQEWTVDALFTNYDNPVDNKMDITYSYLPVSPDRQTSYTDVNANTLILKTDYVMPLWKGKIETGYNFTNRSRKNDYDVLNYSYIENAWVDSMKLSNEFKYTENIHAVYVSLTQKLSKFEIKAGLRMENLSTKGEQYTSNEEFTENYTNLFPDLNIAYKLSEMMPITFNAFRRVKYPQLYYVNPFKVYNGPNSYQAGNPKIRPYFINSFSLNFFQILNCYYVFSTGMVSHATSTVQDSIMMSSYINMNKNKTYGIDVTLPYYNSPSMPVHLPDFVSNMNLRFEYRWSKAYGTYGNEDLTTLNKFASFTANLGLSLWLDISANMYFTYSPKINNPKDIDGGYKYMGISLSKSFYENKLRIGLYISDVLDSQKYEYGTYGTTYYSKTHYNAEKSRGISLSLTYMFNDYKERYDKNIDDGRDSSGKSF